jgi:hypothetical protein
MNQDTFRFEYTNAAISRIEKRLKDIFVLMTRREKETILDWLDNWIADERYEMNRHIPEQREG